MKLFTGKEYMLINLANHFGLDKETYDVRIKWAEDNLHQLESLVDQADEPELFYKSILDIRDAQQGKALGCLVSFDSVCSGIQILSALTRCKSGAKATGLINTGVRPNAYLQVQKAMEAELNATVEVSYKDIKQAVMTSCYGSTAVPEELFEGKALDAFHKACQKVAPGAFNLLPVLRDTWDKNALAHSWTLPDGFHTYVPVLDEDVIRLEVDELGGYKMSTLVVENKPVDFGLANIANVTHSLDSYILRCLIRYCSYDKKDIMQKADLVGAEIIERSLDPVDETDLVDIKDNYVDITVLNNHKPHELTSELLDELADLLNLMLKNDPFEIIPVHDCFSCHPNNMNTLRFWYNEILARLSDSTVLQSILSEMYKQDVRLEVFPESIADEIRQAEYAIC